MSNLNPEGYWIVYIIFSDAEIRYCYTSLPSDGTIAEPCFVVYNVGHL